MLQTQVRAAARRSVRVLPRHLPPLLRDSAAPRRTRDRAGAAGVRGPAPGELRCLQGRQPARVFRPQRLRRGDARTVHARRAAVRQQHPCRGTPAAVDAAGGGTRRTLRRLLPQLDPRRQGPLARTVDGRRHGARSAGKRDQADATPAAEGAHGPHRQGPAAAPERACPADREAAARRAQGVHRTLRRRARANSASIACSTRPGGLPAREVSGSNGMSCWSKARARRAATTCST